ncbi:arrestin domain-containing protein [Dictyostelium discoideum AX4]|uniref:Arrestin domain-containing protein F n=1 Tax=Dictyostelium discoideum TaxID=44689 RepID=ADCF_DICDI|nr:arrestin domain-containing protein [Dictyostelium discoideum AX4]Q54HT7.1 RecName: Full=Arrestin domain-containing protein F [Dictyostelium discoideum]EAL62848.1 arrestin domain-containing protein [Dictyostelium discoideum AX4]|eukprot:XP_636352.1 arrestin domain-containing protein [Dictyostelium discoideum AX4]
MEIIKENNENDGENINNIPKKKSGSKRQLSFKKKWKASFKKNDFVNSHGINYNKSVGVGGNSGMPQRRNSIVAKPIGLTSYKINHNHNYQSQKLTWKYTSPTNSSLNLKNSDLKYLNNENKNISDNSNFDDGEEDDTDNKKNINNKNNNNNNPLTDIINIEEKIANTTTTTTNTTTINTETKNDIDTTISKLNNFYDNDETNNNIQNETDGNNNNSFSISNNLIIKEKNNNNNKNDNGDSDDDEDCKIIILDKPHIENLNDKNKQILSQPHTLTQPLTPTSNNTHKSTLFKKLELPPAPPSPPQPPVFQNLNNCDNIIQHQLENNCDAKNKSINIYNNEFDFKNNNNNIIENNENFEKNLNLLNNNNNFYHNNNLKKSKDNILKKSNNNINNINNININNNNNNNKKSKSKIKIFKKLLNNNIDRLNKNNMDNVLMKSQIIQINGAEIDDGNNYFNKNDQQHIEDNLMFLNETSQTNNATCEIDNLIDSIKINLSNGYFIAGQKVTGNLEISLNQDIKTSGLNLKWKVFEHVIINHYQSPQSPQKLNKKDKEKEKEKEKENDNDNENNNSESLIRDQSFELIDASSLKSFSNSSNCGSSLRNSQSINLNNYNFNNYKGGTLKKNSKIFNVLKNSSSITNFLKINPLTSSSSDFSLNSSSNYNLNLFNENRLIYKNQEKKTIYESGDSIFQTDDNGGIMNSGLHIIPFSFLLPSHLPSSFSDFTIDKETNEKILSAIIYKLSISFQDILYEEEDNDENNNNNFYNQHDDNEDNENIRNKKEYLKSLYELLKDYKIKKSFTVCEPSIIAAKVNEIPIRMEKKKSFLVNSGQISLKVALKRTIFFANEKIPINIKIENASSRSIDYILISIKKIQNISLSLIKKSKNNNEKQQQQIEKDNDEQQPNITDLTLSPSSSSFLSNSSNTSSSKNNNNNNNNLIFKKCTFKTSQRFNGVDAHCNFSDTILFDTNEIKGFNQTTNGTLIKCHYNIVIQCFVKRAFNVVCRIPILFGALPENNLTSIFNDEYQLNLLNM